MGLAPLACYSLKVIFFPQLAKDLSGSWPWLPNKLCLPLKLTPNSNFHTLLRLDVCCGADLASDSRTVHAPCPSWASFHTPESDIWPQRAYSCLLLPALGFSCLNPDSCYCCF